MLRRRCARGRAHFSLFDTQRLIEALWQVIEQCRLADDQVNPGCQGGFLNFGPILSPKPDHWHVLRRGVVLKAPNSSANILAWRVQIRQDQHWFSLFAALDQEIGVANRLDAVLKILQPIDKLRARQ